MAHALPDVREQGMAIDMEGYLSKPVKLTKLAEMVAQELKVLISQARTQGKKHSRPSNTYRNRLMFKPRHRSCAHSN
jgi:hypothetical protein